MFRRYSLLDQTLMSLRGVCGGVTGAARARRETSKNRGKKRLNEDTVTSI